MLFILKKADIPVRNLVRKSNRGSLEIPARCVVKRSGVAVVCIVAFFVSSPTVVAQQPSAPAANILVPRLIRFGGVLKDVSGQPLQGVVGITFELYKDQEGGAALWVETQNVHLEANGHYSVLLGATREEGVPMDLFASGDARWLGIDVQGQPEQARVLLVSVPYALKAADAETLGGRPASAFLTVESKTAPGTSPAGTLKGTATRLTGARQLAS